MRGAAAVAAAGPPNEPTRHEEGADEVKALLIVDGGGKGVAVIKPALLVFKTDGGGEVFDVPAAIAKAVDDFEVPRGYKREGTRDRSFMYSLGVYVEPVDKGDKELKHKYFCMADATCRKNKHTVPCKNGDRSNVNTHHRLKHKLCGAASVVKAANKSAGKGSSIEKSSNASKNSGAGTNNSKRVYELLCARMVVEKFLPFSFFSSCGAWQELAGLLSKETTDDAFLALSSRRIKHLLVEMYIATKKVVIGSIQEDMKKAALPIVHYGLDLWTCKVSGRKYLGIHVFWVDSNFILRHALIAVKHYAPAADILETEKVSEIIFTIFQATLAEYGITLADLAGGTADGGPDVKAMCVDFLMANYQIWWDWRDCHLADKAVENAFATSADPQKSKNWGARYVLRLVIKTAAKANQSATFKQKFEELQLEMLDEIFKITKHAPQRWLTLVRTMERIIRLWHVLRKVFADDGEEFPLDKGNNKDAILQLYSLLQPLSAITRDGQSCAVPMTAEMRLAFAQLKVEVLNPTKPLRVFDIPTAPGSPEAEQEGEGLGGEGGQSVQGKKGKKPELPSAMVAPEKLLPITVKARKELNKALVQRLYGRVWDTADEDSSPFRDAAVLLTPPFNNGRYLEAFRLSEEDAEYLASGKQYLAPTTGEEVSAKLADCWTDITKRAEEAARKEERRSASAVVDGQPTLKRIRTDGKRSNATGKARFSSFGRCAAVDGAGGSQKSGDDDGLVRQVVAGDVLRYQGLCIPPDEMDCKDVLRWWGSSGKLKFPSLAPVAQQVFGSQAAAAQAELDFSGCGNLLKPDRSRIDTYWVEMVMFLKANYEHIPEHEDIPMVAAKDIRACLPERFTGKDTDLVAAEAAFDVLTNTAAPTTGGMSFEED